MANSGVQAGFDRLNSKVKKFDISDKTVLIPLMGQYVSPLMAASFRAVGTHAVALETYTGLSLGKEFTSGKECFPCQVTLGDVLYHLQKEKERLGPSFSPDRYVYFMPEADGPCRFGMYTKMQRLVLDRFEEYRDIPIVYLSTGDAYSTSSILPPRKAPLFRRLCYVAFVAADILDRIVWRVRPYEYRRGITDEFITDALAAMEACIEADGGSLEFSKIYRLLEETARTAKGLMDPARPRRPRIGIIGEIYLRSHCESNQHIVRQIEKFGGEVVDASMTEWINFVTSERIRKLKRRWEMAWNDRDYGSLREIARQWMGSHLERGYQLWRQAQAYGQALKHLDIEPDHSIGAIERRLDGNRLFHFAIGTEAVLSIGGALEYAHHGYDGIVNVFPFTCMPSTICSAVLKPLLHEMGIPYLDATYDGAIQPNRDIALRTFIYQARQHMESRLTGRNGKAKKT